MSKTTSTPVPVAPGASVTISAAQLTRALRILDPIRSNDCGRPLLNGFYLERGPDDRPVFVARADSKGFPYVSWRSITSQERQETEDGTPVAFNPRYLSDMCKVVESLGWGAGQTPIRFVGGLSGMAEVRAEADNLAFHGLLMAVRIS